MVGRANALTSTAHTRSRGEHKKVGACELVTAFAVCLSAIDNPSRIASLDIHSWHDGFKVGWVDAASVLAQMVDLEPLRDLANELCVGDAVGEQRPPRAV
jgi:hypothetical protein